MEELKAHTYKWYEFGCKDASYIKTKSDYTSLKFSEKFLYFFHLLICKYCRRFVKQINRIEALLKVAPDTLGLELSPEKKVAINQLITEKLEKN